MIYRLETATGLLKRSIAINGDYLLVDECTVTTEQEIDHKWLIQGGPYSAIATFGQKMIKGTISFPLRVDADGHLEPAAQHILENAARPFTPISIDTNHVFHHFTLTSEYDEPDDNNELLSFDCCLVEKLTITATNSQGVPIKVTANIVGMIDSRVESNVITPAEGARLGRALTWADCSASTIYSALRSVYTFQIECSSKVEPLVFLLPMQTEGPDRNDQTQYLVSHECRWKGSYEEILQLSAEKESYIHGGWMVGGNLAFNIGPITAIIPVPLFKPSEQPLTAKFLKRKINFAAHMSPSKNQDSLFSFF